MINKLILTLKSKGLLMLIIAIYYFLLRKIYIFLNKKYILKKIYNFKMKLYLDDEGISKTLILFGQRELDHKFMLEILLKPNMNVLDIGSNIGYYLLIEKKLIGDKGFIIAVEPSSKNISLLKENLNINNINNYKIVHGAISNKPGRQIFHLSSKSNLNTFHIENINNLSLTGETEDVSTNTVSQITGDKKIDLIRMDVEGHEVQIIDGLINDISEKLKPMIIFEPHTSRYSQNLDFKIILLSLFKKNYSTLMISSNSISGTKIIEKYGYKSIKIIKTDDVERRIYKNISNEDVIDFITKTGGLRTVVFVPNDIYKIDL